MLPGATAVLTSGALATQASAAELAVNAGCYVVAAPCGRLKVRARLYPTTPRHSTFSVQYDNRRTYSEASRPRIIGPLKLSV